MTSGMYSGNGVGAVPTGLRNIPMEFLFPTLKRGANKHCAYGAHAATWRKETIVQELGSQ